MEVDAAQTGLASADLVQAQLHDRQKEIYVLKPALTLSLEYPPVTVDAEVVVDAENLEFGGKDSMSRKNLSQISSLSPP